jgi:hypothetical protein
VTAGVTAGVGDGGGPYEPGRLIGDVSLADGSRLADHAHLGTFVLLDRSPGQELSQLAEPWQDRVTVVTDDHRDGPRSLLARPDGVIAWADDGQQAAGSLEEALRRWAGAPAADRQVAAR